MDNSLDDGVKLISAQRELSITERTEALAYTLWIERGCPEGTPGVDWFEAERRLTDADGPDPIRRGESLSSTGDCTFAPA